MNKVVKKDDLYLSIRNMRQLYNCFPIRSALWSELTWNHSIEERLKAEIEKDIFELGLRVGDDDV